MIARLADGLTAFHISIRCGNVPMVRAMIERSQKNAAEEEKKMIRIMNRSRVLVEVLRVIPVSEYSGEENNEHNHGPYQTIFKFKGTAPDTVVQRGYLLPFQAAWEGDCEL